MHACHLRTPAHHLSPVLACLVATPQTPTHLHSHSLHHLISSPEMPSKRKLAALPPTITGKVALLLSVVLPLCILGILLEGQKISYMLRPIWDTPPKPFQFLTHYYYDNISLPELCALHGWQVRESPRRVFDAVLFSNELDMLELRWRELLSVVNRFIIVESDTTFTGRLKPLLLLENMRRFSFAEPKIVYGILESRELEMGESPFVLEKTQRLTAKQLLEEAGIQEGDLVIMSDVDEIPSAHTVNLLRWCDNIPDVLHLQLSYYLYSFEFFVDKSSWRASASLYRPGITYYGHSRKADVILADAGWHCSFCFRYLEEIAFKMQAFSHADRIKSESFLDLKRIQDRICRGADLFDMLPEEYSMRKLLLKLGNVPSSYSAVHLPAFLLQNPNRFSFLLPANCMRQSDAFSSS